MASAAPSISFCNAPPLHLTIPTRDPSNVFSSCGTLEDMVASYAGAPPIIQGLQGTSMVCNRLDEVIGDAASRKRNIELAMEGGICMRMSGAGYERGYNDRQVGEGERRRDMQGGDEDEEEEEEEEEEEILAYEKQRGYMTEGNRGGAGEYVVERNRGGVAREEAGEEQGNMQIWKKRKLSAEQVRCLERSFEVERKLEGQRKTELAMQLRLEPRQIAVWFQNRRARWKSKQLEHDYLALKASFASLQAHFDALLAQKHDLLRQVNALKSKLQQGDDPLKYDAIIGTIDERGIQLENIDQENKKLEVENIGATSGLDDTKKIGKDKEAVENKDNEIDKGGINEVRHKVESSTFSSTEGSAVSEAINSPHAIESGIIDSQGTLIDTSLTKNDVNSSFSSLLPQARPPMQSALSSPPPLLTLGTFDFFNLNNECVKVEPIEQGDIETEHKYCFILEDNAEGAFPWWN